MRSICTALGLVICLNAGADPRVISGEIGDFRLARFLWDQESSPMVEQDRIELEVYMERDDRDVTTSPNRLDETAPRFLEGNDRDVTSILARYVWDEENSQDGSPPPLPALAQFIWDEEYRHRPDLHESVRQYKHQYMERDDRDVTILPDGERISDEPSIREILDGDDSALNPAIARYLWDEESGQSQVPEPLLSRYLWDEESGKGQDSQGPDHQVARYLWDEESGSGNVQGVEEHMERYLWGDAQMVFDSYYQVASSGNFALEPKQQDYIVIGKDLERLKATVSLAGSQVDEELSFIRGVALTLTRAQYERLRVSPNVTSIFPNQGVRTAGKVKEGPQGRHRQTYFPMLIGADDLHREGLTGKGVGVAIIDSGIWDARALIKNTEGRNRIVAYYDAIADSTTLPLSDENGHGSHIASVVASSESSVDEYKNATGSYHGVAPDADLVIVKAFDENGRGTYEDVIRAISYVIEHRDEHNIRVLNLSFAATPMSHYWQDPLNLAVMAAWEAGIVVVVSSGNDGPDPMTIGVPGNVPYVVTVGAMTDNYTPYDPTDDYLATFSSAGPTFEGFVKPEVVAPGGHITGVVSGDTSIADEHPDFHDGAMYFLMSGTSQASAVSAGVAALMLQAEPDLSADDVKCRLMASAEAAVREDGSLAYSLFQQGAGLINAYNAVYSEATGCANQALDLAKDLAGLEHYGGPANQDSDGNFYMTTTEGYIWNLGETSGVEGYIWNLAQLWNEGYIWNLGYVWNLSELESNGYIWNLSDFESNGYIWNLANLDQQGYIWNLSDTENAGYIWNLSNSSYFVNMSDLSTNRWVSQE